MATRLFLSIVMALLCCGYSPSTYHQDTEQSIPHGCGVITGRVIDTQGNPVAGVEVRAMITDHVPRGRLFSSITDSDGKFSIPCVEPGKNGVYTSKEDDGYPDNLLTPFRNAAMRPKLDEHPIVDVVDQKITAGVEIRLGPPAGRLTVQVTDANTSAPIENATITFCMADDAKVCQSIDIGKSGEYSILLPPIPLTLKVSAPKYQDWRYQNQKSTEKADILQVSPKGNERLTVSLTPR